MFARLFRRTGAAPVAPRPRLPLLSLIIVGVVGVFVLLDVLVADPTLDFVGQRAVDYAMIIAAFALVLGLFHLVRVHAWRVRERGNGWLYSLLLLIVTVFFSVVGLLEGPNGTVTQWSVSTMLIPLQAAFFSLLAFFLVSVLYRAARVRSVETLLMVGTALVVVIGGSPLGSTIAPALGDFREWVLNGVATAGARAIVIGVAIGTLVTAFRFVADGRRLFR
jgi:hypothetical protein